MTAFIVAWVLCGICGCNLMHSLTDKHSDMAPYTPSCVWFVVSGPIIFLFALLISVGFALGWGEEKESQ